MKDKRTDSSKTWWQQFFAAADSLVPDACAPWFSEDVELHFPPKPAIKGREPVLASFDGLRAALESMRHEPIVAVEDVNSAFVETKIFYDFKDGTRRIAHAASYLHRNQDGKVDQLHIVTSGD